MAEHANSIPAPAEHPALARHRFRQRLTIAINRLIRALDEIDGDPDLEPSLAHPEFNPGLSQHRQERTLPLWHHHETDLEEQCEGEGEACEDEGAVTGDDEPEVGV